MIKILGILLILISSTVVGFMYGEGMKKRVKDLNELLRGVYILKNEINYMHSLLPEALMKVSEKCTGIIKKIFVDASTILLSNEEVDVYTSFKKSIDINKSNINLTKEDLSIFLDLTKSLGELDVDGHNDIFSLVTENLNKAIIGAESNLEKSIKMYRYLGFSFGAMIAIVLI
ncbi:stage III sporulation protein SpoIIIAB [Clostridium sp. UBA4548]|uniref:stage III sporulation protein SpoIIIAB n=1 Tax=Clostridium sp. UBA4548 TaxID=1946361 RepID=UPI0025C02593|nr:stage III sporulation protein SpoIIIAB [Clostridium sp. UBA4548]